jgi:hypothetical protein
VQCSVVQCSAALDVRGERCPCYIHALTLVLPLHRGAHEWWLLFPVDSSLKASIVWTHVVLAELMDCS